MYRNSTKRVRIVCLAAAAILSVALINANADYAYPRSTSADGAMPLVQLEPVTVVAYAPVALADR
jgi:hypothetical protein